MVRFGSLCIFVLGCSQTLESQAPNVTAGDPLGLNDVSILWPMPETGTLPAGYLKLFPGSGERGPGIPEAARQAIPNLHADVPDAIVWAATAIVAMRIDPCARSVDGSCTRELRLSAETINPSFDDAAVHLIYELDEPSFDALVTDLREWRASSPVPTDGILRVHPGLAKAGIASPYARELHDIVERFATEEALVRVTVNAFAFDTWGFSRLDRATGWERVGLPGLQDGTGQAWRRLAQIDNMNDPSGAIEPLPAQNFAALLRADALAQGPGATAVLEARDAIVALEHPAKASAATHDCVSCHLSDGAHRWAEKRGVSFDIPERWRPPADIDVATDVPPELDGNVSNTIAFGYHRVHHGKLVPSISRRVIAESAEVVVQLSQTH